MHTKAITKLIFGTALAISGLIQAFNHQTWWFIQNVNLIFHEAGHVILIFFGDFLHTLGGTLFEIMIPLVVIFHFYYSKQYFSAAFAAWWLSTALLSVSIYAGDAQERVLPLITNDVTTHDWFNLLSMTGLLRHDDLIGYIFWCCSLTSIGLLMFLLSKDNDINRFLKRRHETNIT